VVGVEATAARRPGGPAARRRGSGGAGGAGGSMAAAGGSRRRPTASARKASRGSPEPAEAEGGVKGNLKGRQAGAGRGGLDAALSKGIYDTASRCVPRRALKFFEHAGSGLLWFPLAIFLWLMPVHDTFEGIGSDWQRGLGAFLFFGMLIELAVVGLLKVVVRRSRPAWNNSGDFLLVASADQWSFPSGHASRAAQVFLWLVCCIPAYDNPLSEWYSVLVPTIGWALATTLSRVALGRHYVSDTLAGVCVGTAIVAVMTRGTFNLDNASLGKLPVPARFGTAGITLNTEYLIDSMDPNTFREQTGLGQKFNQAFTGSIPGWYIQEWVDRVNDAATSDEVAALYNHEKEPMYRALLNLPRVQPQEPPVQPQESDDESDDDDGRANQRVAKDDFDDDEGDCGIEGRK